MKWLLLSIALIFALLALMSCAPHIEGYDPFQCIRANVEYQCGVVGDLA